MEHRYWLSNDEFSELSQPPDNFLRGELGSARRSRRQNTSEHVAVSYWRQDEVNAPVPGEVDAHVEPVVDPQSQYTERILRGLVSSHTELVDVVPSESGLEMDDFSSILAGSTKQRFVAHHYLEHVLDYEKSLEYEEYYDDGATYPWSPDTVRVA